MTDTFLCHSNDVFDTSLGHGSDSSHALLACWKYVSDTLLGLT